MFVEVQKTGNCKITIQIKQETYIHFIFAKVLIRRYRLGVSKFLLGIFCCWRVVVCFSRPSRPAYRNTKVECTFNCILELRMLKMQLFEEQDILRYRCIRDITLPLYGWGRWKLILRRKILIQQILVKFGV